MYLTTLRNTVFYQYVLTIIKPLYCFDLSYLAFCPVLPRHLSILSCLNEIFAYFKMISYSFSFSKYTIISGQEDPYRNLKEPEVFVGELKITLFLALWWTAYVYQLWDIIITLIFLRLWLYLISWLDEMLEHKGNKFSLFRMFYEGFLSLWYFLMAWYYVMCNWIDAQPEYFFLSSWQHGVTLEMFWRVRAKFLKLKAPIEMLCTTAATWLTCFIICEYALLSLVWFIFETCGERLLI